MDRFIVRPALPGDRASIDAMLARSYPPLLAPDYDPVLLAAALPAMTRANPALLDSDTWFVAVAQTDSADTDLLVGCGGWTRAEPGTGKVEPKLGHVRHFGTDIDHLRCGVARMIAARMFETARAAGITTLDCYSTLSAERFYAALGFRTIEAMTVPMPYLDRHGELVNFPAMLMRAEL